jgi:hypothetical protein
MAVDETLKYKIRAIYESNNLSPKKVKEEHFPAEDVSDKTIASWVSKEGWIKNKYSSLTQAFEKLLGAEVEEKLKEKGREIVEGEVIGAMPETFKDAITAEAVRQALTINFMHQEMVKNLLRMGKLAEHSGSMGTLATYQAAQISTYHALHGKEVRHTFTDLDSLSDEELENLPTEQLEQLLINAKSKK